MKGKRDLIVTTLATTCLCLIYTVQADTRNDCSIPKDKFHWLALDSLGIGSAYMRSIEQCKIAAKNKQHLDRLDRENMRGDLLDLAFRKEIHQVTSGILAQPTSEKNMNQSITTMSGSDESYDPKAALPRVGDNTNMGVLK